MPYDYAPSHVPSESLGWKIQQRDKERKRFVAHSAIEGQKNKLEKLFSGAGDDPIDTMKPSEATPDYVRNIPALVQTVTRFITAYSQRQY